MEPTNKTNTMTQGALMAALYMLILLIFVYVPIISYIALIFLPLPFIVLMYHHGLKPTLVMVAVTLFITPLLTPLPVLFVTVIVAAVGVVMGYFYKQRKSGFLPLLSGIVTYIVTFVFSFVAINVILNINVMTLMSQLLQENIIMAEDMAAMIGVELDPEMVDVLHEMQRSFVYMIPGALIILSLFLTTLNHAASRLVFKRLGMNIESLPPFREWNFPRSVLFYYLITLLLRLFEVGDEGTVLYILVINSSIVLEVLMIIQGLTFIFYFSYVKKLGRFLPVLAVALSLIPLFSGIIRLIGIIDIGFDLKKRIKPAD